MPRLALGLPLLFVAATASAQSVALDDFRPAIDSRGYLTLNASEVLDDQELSFGLGSLEWGRHLLSFTNGPSTYSVDDMVSATLVAALGLHLGPVPLEVGASLPFTIVDGSRGAETVDPASPNGTMLNRLAAQGLGDLGLHLKARLAHAGRFGAAAIASVYVPTSSARDPFLGEPGVTPQLVAIGDATFGRFRVAINGGVRMRRATTFTAMTAAGTMGTITTATELPVGIGAAWALAPEKLELIAEVFGAVPLGDHHGYQSLEALGGVKVYLAKNSYLSLGAGRGLVAGEAGNPDFRAVIGIVFEPKPAAPAAAHIPDDVVAIAPPAKPATGWSDRDNDGIPDHLDKCPDDPENYNGYKDEDGCPDVEPRDVVVDVGTKLTVMQSIEFEFDSAVIRRSSFFILDAVVQTMQDNPDILLVEVGGHTDERGDDAYNLDLSARRAASVVQYLTEHGIAAARLTSQGFGETRPLDPAHTDAAWTKNRRVEFSIKQRL